LLSDAAFSQKVGPYFRFVTAVLACMANYQGLLGK
jgi:hypothetical protein